MSNNRRLFDAIRCSTGAAEERVNRLWRKQIGIRMVYTVFCTMLLAAVVPLDAQVPVTISVNGGLNSRGAMTLWIDSYSMTIRYGEFSNAASIAANFGGRISLDSAAPVWAKGFTDGTIKMQMRHGGRVNNIHIDITPDSGSGSPPIVVSTNPGGVAGGALPSGSTVYSYSIAKSDGSSGYDSAGNIVAYDDSVNQRWSASYDSLNRIATAAQVVLPTAPPNTSIPALWGSGQQQYFCWQYDSFGNRKAQASSGSPFSDLAGCANPGTTAFAATRYSYNESPSANNRINSVMNETSSGPQLSISDAAGSYDAAGNLIDDGVFHYQYDAANRLCAVRKSATGMMVGYLYDGDGNRVAKGTLTPQTGNWCDFSTNGFTLSSREVLGPDGQTLTEFGGTGSSRSDIPLAEGVVATLTATTTTAVVAHLHFTDWLGTRRVQTDMEGNSEQVCFGAAFGDGLSCSGASGTPKYFTGKERDVESGLDYMTARYYASTMGRFTSADPLQFNELRLINPQRWNMYAYAVNDPLSFTDPDGRDAIAVNFGADVGGLGHMGIISVHADGNATYSRFGPQHPGSPADVGQVRTTTDLPKVQFDSNGNPTEASYTALTTAVAKFEDNYTGPVKMFHYKTSEAETSALDAYIKAAQAASDAHKLNYVGPFSTCVTYCMIGLHRAGVDRAALLGLHPLTMVPNYFAYLLSTNADSQHGEKVTSRIVPDSIKPVQ